MKALKKEDVFFAKRHKKAISQFRLKETYDEVMDEIDNIEKELKQISFGCFDEKPFIVFRGVIQKAFGEAIE